MSDDVSLAAHFRRGLQDYMRKEQIDVPALARQIEESVPGMLAVPVRSLEMFLHGTSEPSDAFISICGRYLARTVQSSR